MATTRTRNVSEYALVLALCLVINILWAVAGLLITYELSDTNESS